ncbi:hypothetical protein INT47_004147 [Mucor saturninus]|uniref:Uncharacterized protein n=1 Tax=Mucor saturninus TaxID=64648 RepID=A0A8H7UX62_9FUNG|nr:hypothetical protein INT47_004147 [Mucor saturninus]
MTRLQKITYILPPHYAFFVPTDWDFEIRKEIIRPLFEEAGQMAKSDHGKKLLFFTQLETTFQYLQAQDPSTDLTIQTPIVNGQRLVMYGLKFAGDNLSVRLDLFSAEYPNLQSLGTHYTAKNHQINVSLASNVEEGIENCLKVRAFNLEDKKYRKLLSEMIKQYQENRFISSTSDQKLSQPIHSSTFYLESQRHKKRASRPRLLLKKDKRMKMLSRIGKPVPNCTTSAHYIKFISEVLNATDKIGNIKGYFFVMDNCSCIHKNKYIQREISSENFWSLVKGKIKRVFFTVGETMVFIINAACKDTHLNDLYAFYDHSKRQIIECCKK